MTEQIAMIRNHWLPEHKAFHVEQWKNYGVTVLICQRKTKDLIMLCLESLLRFYPDIPILVVDGDSQDDSIIYLRWMAVKHPNIRIWEKKDGYHSHGVTMDTAIRHHIETPYVLLMDSDTIMERGDGVIERMKQRCEPYPPSAGHPDDFEKYPEEWPFAVGSLMLVSRKNQGCGSPVDEKDVLRYAHPSFSMINRKHYMKLRPFTDHGAPCWDTMDNAAQLNLRVEYFPVDRYVSHLSGASWCKPPTIWPHDHGVLTRPFVTFIQKDKTTAIPIPGGAWGYEIIFDSLCVNTNVVVHGSEPVNVSNYLYNIRFSVRGEYVCVAETPSQYHYVGLPITRLMGIATKLNAPEEFKCGGWTFIRRDIWQRVNCLQ